jgi:hypothetical protein
MVTELQELLRRNVAAPPPDHLDLGAVVTAGRRRVRWRRGAAGAVALATAAIVAVAALSWPGAGGDGAVPASVPPAPAAPTLDLADATQAIEGRDYEVVTSYTNKDLDADNGQYLDGVTTDGLVLFRDGPRSGQLYPRFALLDPATGAKDWLPRLDIGQTQTWPVELDEERLVLLGAGGGGLDAQPAAYVFDRAARTWTTMTWPTLPDVEFPHGVLGQDGRLYVFEPATQGAIPEGGWPTGPDGEAEDADAEGDTFHLWSVSLTDPADVRDEQLTVGDVAFTDDAMVWTDRSGGDPGRVHVRDLASGEESSFDPQVGERCNLLGFGARGDRIVMSQYCGTYAGGVRDDRVQIVDTDGAQVVTLQDSGIEGSLPPGSDVVNVEVHAGPDDDTSGTYVYDLTTNRFQRLTDGLSMWGLGGPTGEADQVMWHTPYGKHGATQWIGRLLP